MTCLVCRMVEKTFVILLLHPIGANKKKVLLQHYKCHSADDEALWVKKERKCDLYRFWVPIWFLPFVKSIWSSESAFCTWAANGVSWNIWKDSPMSIKVFKTKFILKIRYKNRAFCFLEKFILVWFRWERVWLKSGVRGVPGIVTALWLLSCSSKFLQKQYKKYI